MPHECLITWRRREMKRQGVRNWRQSSDKHKEVRKEAKVEDDGCFGHGECKVTLQLNVEFYI